MSFFDIVKSINRSRRFARSFTTSRVALCRVRTFAITRTFNQGNNDMTRKTNTTSRVFPCVLKTIIANAIDEKTIIDDNAKKIRARLRVAFRDQHVKNTSWIATNMREYDAIRCAFDNVYSQRMIDARKRATKTRAKAKTQTNVETTTND